MIIALTDTADPGDLIVTDVKNLTHSIISKDHPIKIIRKVNFAEIYAETLENGWNLTPDELLGSLGENKFYYEVSTD